MIVYKYFLKTALRHKMIILSYAVIFFMLSIINGIDTENKEITFDETKLDIAIVDDSNTDLSRGLKNYLDENNNIVNLKNDIKEIKEQIFLQQIDAAIIIPSDFEENVKGKQKSLEVIKDDRKISSIQIENEINKYLIFANASKVSGEFKTETINNALKENINVEILEKSSDVNNSANIWFKYYFNFTAYIITAIYIAVMGLIMTEFKDEKLENRTKISSKKFLNYNKEMYLGQITLGVIITGLFVIGSIVLKGQHLEEVNFTKYIVNVSIFSFAILCLTFLINNLTKSRFIINGLSTVLSLGTAFISGVMVPVEYLSEKVITIAKFFPTYYYIKINNMDISSLSDIRYELIIQILFGVAFLLLGVYFSKVKQKA
ncbi:ABC transporter permease [Senegalia massiliensis]|uniref:ABC transporter permease n=1 Tax=Senegalia massiliensis TaxID=1720316 RepID=A0A845QVD6_9CLOT|nr:ABC transporter permease [Senegalia massiliensis]NBI06201.1 ABC transporter permease [Senegalia massiliensis]